jgi:hypothetical protein
VFSLTTRPRKQVKCVGSPHVNPNGGSGQAHVARQFCRTIIMSTEQSSPTIEATELESAVDIQVFNSDGGIVRFGDIFADQKTIVVFIRTPPTPHIIISSY